MFGLNVAHEAKVSEKELLRRIDFLLSDYSNHTQNAAQERLRDVFSSKRHLDTHTRLRSPPTASLT
jgi:hypothetical protein